MSPAVPNFPGYRIEALIGEGGAGRVFRAVKLDTGAAVAIKVFHAYRVNAPEFTRRFEREVTLSKTIEHPGVVRLLDQVRSDDGKNAALVMELVEGQTLRPRLSGGALAPREALAIAMQITQTLGHMHRKSVAHLDLKPENVLLVGDRVRLMDFGISQATFGQLSRDGGRTQVIAGTPHYMSPEQFAGSKTLDHRSDLFTIGVMLHEMLVGERPSAGVLALGDALPPRFRAELEVVLTKLLEFDPTRRYQTAVDVTEKLRALDRLLADAEAARTAAAQITTLNLKAADTSPRPAPRKLPEPSKVFAVRKSLGEILREQAWIVVVLAFLVFLGVIYNLVVVAFDAG